MCPAAGMQGAWAFDIYRPGTIHPAQRNADPASGLTDHGYFPLTCTPPMDTAYYRKAVQKYQEIGFNWIRFHTTAPHEAYLDACDELGMMVQVEAPMVSTIPSGNRFSVDAAGILLSFSTAAATRCL